MSTSTLSAGPRRQLHLARRPRRIRPARRSRLARQGRRCRPRRRADCRFRRRRPCRPAIASAPRRSVRPPIGRSGPLPGLPGLGLHVGFSRGRGFDDGRIEDPPRQRKRNGPGQLLGVLPDGHVDGDQCLARRFPAARRNRSTRRYLPAARRWRRSGRRCPRRLRSSCSRNRAGPWSGRGPRRRFASPMRINSPIDGQAPPRMAIARITSSSERPRRLSHEHMIIACVAAVSRLDRQLLQVRSLRLSVAVPVMPRSSTSDADLELVGHDHVGVRGSAVGIEQDRPRPFAPRTAWRPSPSARSPASGFRQRVAGDKHRPFGQLVPSPTLAEFLRGIGDCRSPRTAGALDSRASSPAIQGWTLYFAAAQLVAEDLDAAGLHRLTWARVHSVRTVSAAARSRRSCITPRRAGARDRGRRRRESPAPAAFRSA